jgi:putative ABC transport system permease protein
LPQNKIPGAVIPNSMGVWSIVQMALRALSRNKLRTMLTMLGITIGIAAVICTVALGNGGQQMIEAQLDNLGDNMVWVEAGGRNLQGVRTGNGATKSLRVEDALAMPQAVAEVKSVSPNVDGHVQAIYGGKNWGTQFRGVSPEYLTIRRWKIGLGGSFTANDVDRIANVCLLGQTVVEQLFGDEDPIGKTIRVSTIPCLIVGTLLPKGLSPNGGDQDDFVLMPYTTAQRKLKGIDWLDDVYCSTYSADDIDRATQELTFLLRQRHHIRPDEPDDFNVRHPEDILKARKEAGRTFGLMLATTASVALLIGGIGIMNIMLVSVTERTREIGVRMSVGATESDVRGQFLIEALVLSLLGGGCGIFFGIFASAGLSAMLAWPSSVSIPAIVISLLFSGAIGITFGYYPASKAASLDPIEALRYE